MNEENWVETTKMIKNVQKDEKTEEQVKILPDLKCRREKRGRKSNNKRKGGN